VFPAGLLLSIALACVVGWWLLNRAPGEVASPSEQLAARPVSPNGHTTVDPLVRESGEPQRLVGDDQGVTTAANSPEEGRAAPARPQFESCAAAVADHYGVSFQALFDLIRKELGLDASELIEMLEVPADDWVPWGDVSEAALDKLRKRILQTSPPGAEKVALGILGEAGGIPRGCACPPSVLNRARGV
jgi:hypothetical protein